MIQNTKRTKACPSSLHILISITKKKKRCSFSYISGTRVLREWEISALQSENGGVEGCFRRAILPARLTPHSQQQVVLLVSALFMCACHTLCERTERVCGITIALVLCTRQREHLSSHNEN